MNFVIIVLDLFLLHKSLHRREISPRNPILVLRPLIPFRCVGNASLILTAGSFRVILFLIVTTAQLPSW